MSDRAELPVSDERIFEIARDALKYSPTTPRLPRYSPTVPLKLGSCAARRRAEDGHILEFVITVLVDPRLGVPAQDPAAEPRWGAPTVLEMHFDAHGALLRAARA